MHVLILQSETINISINSQRLLDVDNIKPKDSLMGQFDYVAGFVKHMSTLEAAKAMGKKWLIGKTAPKQHLDSKNSSKNTTKQEGKTR